MGKLIQILAILAGLGAMASGPVLGLALAAWRPAGSSGALDSASLGLALIGAGGGLGAALAWSGWKAGSGRPSRPFALPGWGWLALAYLACLAGGQLAFSKGLTAAMPVLHLAAGALPGLIWLSVAAGAARRRGGMVAGPAAAASLAWGALGGSAAAMAAEMVLAIGLLVAAIAWLSISEPALIDRLRLAAEQIQYGGQLDAEWAQQILSSPRVALVALIGLGVGVPVIEETTKALAVPLVALAGRRLRPVDGFLLGVAAGAGFTVVEGVLNGSLALALPATWGAIMLARAGTAAVHCLASGLAGLGWQAGLADKGWLRAAGLGLAAVAIHGAWNSATAVLALSALRAQAGGITLLPGLLMLLALGLLVVLWLGCVAGLPVLARHSYHSSVVSDQSISDN